jgi:hypothetical protein
VALQAACARFEGSSVANAVGIQVSATPSVVSFARELKVRIWSLKRIGQIDLHAFPAFLAMASRVLGENGLRKSPRSDKMIR